MSKVRVCNSTRFSMQTCHTRHVCGTSCDFVGCKKQPVLRIGRADSASDALCLKSNQQCVRQLMCQDLEQQDVRTRCRWHLVVNTKDGAGGN